MVLPASLSSSVLKAQDPRSRLLRDPFLQARSRDALPAAVTQLLSIDECFYCIDYEDIERFEHRRFGDAFVQIQAR